MTRFEENLGDPTVFVVDDDSAMRDSLVWLLQSVGLTAEPYPSAEAFLSAHEPARPGCLVADVRLPGMSGIALQEELKQRRTGLPVILITGYGEVSTAVKAMKWGAIDYIEKPFCNQVLLDSIRRALNLDAERRRLETQRERLRRRYERLTPREREIMRMIVAGTSTKVIAYDLRISAKTVEVHRAHVMQKMQASSIAELVRVGVTELSDN